MQSYRRLLKTTAKGLFIAGILIALWATIVAFNSGTLHSAFRLVPRAGNVQDVYQSLNRKVQASQGDVDLIFVGDSITHHWAAQGRDAWERYYGDRKALNLGVRGDKTQDVLWRLDNGNLDGLEPKVAVVMIGTNNLNIFSDSVAEIVAGVTAVVQKLQAKVPGIKILLLDIFPRGQSFNGKRGKLLQVNQTLRKMHNGKTVVYLPIGHIFLQPDGTIAKSVMPDYLHLSPLGYELWAAEIEPTLSAMLGDKAK
jgi:beta-glucosidase